MPSQAFLKYSEIQNMVREYVWHLCFSSASDCRSKSNVVDICYALCNHQEKSRLQQLRSEKFRSCQTSLIALQPLKLKSFWILHLLFRLVAPLLNTCLNFYIMCDKSWLLAKINLYSNQIQSYSKSWNVKYAHQNRLRWCQWMQTKKCFNQNFDINWFKSGWMFNWKYSDTLK